MQEEIYVFPLSFSQERLWFVDSLDPGNPAYNMATALWLEGRLDEAALRASLAEVVARHEILRTTFPLQNGVPVQAFRPDLPVGIETVDCTHLSDDARRDEAHRRAEEDARRPFDLAAGPLLRMTLCRFAPEHHLLLLNMHHIIGDGWSVGVFITEMAQLYRGLSGPTRTLPQLPELEIQYGDFAEWQRESLQGEVLAQRLSYWRRRLEGLPGLLALPTDRPRPAVAGLAGAAVHFDVNPGLTLRLRGLARAPGHTLFMTLQAAYAVLLARYARTEDVVVGVPIAGRTRVELEPLIGFFVNTLVLRTDLGGDPDFLEVLGRVRTGTLEAFAHQDLPFEKLVEELQPERNLSHNPLFQAAFSLDNTPPSGFQLANLTTRPLTTEGVAAKFDLSLTMEETRTGLRGSLEYRVDLFESATMQHMVDAFLVLLEALAEHPERPVFRAPMTRAAALLDEPEHGVPDLNLYRLFQQQVWHTPRAVAVEAGAESCTYAELDRAAARIAALLHVRGVGIGARVGICLERCLDMPAAMLGVLRVGATYVPLDPAFPAERIAYMVDDAAMALILTTQSLAKILRAEAVPRVFLDQGVGAHDAAAPAPAYAGPHQGAYMIYTSGSTGKPKGVLLTQGGLVNHMVWMAAAYPLSDSDRVLQKTPISFDASVWEIYAPLLSGATLVMAGAGAHREPHVLARVVAEGQITVLQTVPSLLEVLLEEPAFSAPNRLKRVFCGGEALSATLRDRFYSLVDADLINLYGPTETCIQCTAGVCPPGEDLVTMGKPVHRMQMHVLDGHMQPVPVGAPGELFVAGPGLARGYQGLRGLTAASLVPHPFSARPGARLYRTGDLVRQTDRQGLVFLGRVDHQVKLRGFRIELGEIEAVLARMPEVQHAVVRVHGGELLTAYLQGDPEDRTLETRAAEVVRGRLPAYMVPGAWVVLPQMPLLPNGKINRKGLPDPKPPARAERVAPRTDTETVLADIWCEILGHDTVGIHDDFFQLGGHSLTATRVMARLRTRLQVDLPVRVLFEAPTIAQLATRLDEQKGTPTIPPEQMGTPTIPPARIGTPTDLPEQMGTPIISPEQMGTPTNSSEQMGTPTFSPARIGTPTDSSEQMGTPTKSPEQMGTPTIPPGQMGTPTDSSGQMGTPTDSSEQMGTPTIPPGQMGTPTFSPARIGTPTDSSEQIGTPTFSPARIGTPTHSLEQEQMGTPTDSSEQKGTPTISSEQKGIPTFSPEQMGTPIISQMEPRIGTPTDSLGQMGTPTNAARIGTPTDSSEQKGTPTKAARIGTPTHSLEHDRIGTPTHEDQPEQKGTPTKAARIGTPTHDDRVDRIGTPTHDDRDDRVGTPTHDDRDDRVGTPTHDDRVGTPTLGAGTPVIPPRPHQAQAPLSFAQQRLWFLDRLAEGGDGTYNIPGVLRLRGRLDLDALARALAAVVARHETLRTAFAEVDGLPVQLIHPVGHVSPVLVDFEDRADRDAAVAAWVAAEALRPFDLTHAGLLRVSVLRLAAADHVLLVTMHHIISDGWSFGVLVHELLAFYLDATGVRPFAPPPLPVQYADYAVWQHARASGDAWQARLAYWKTQLADAPAFSDLPTDEPRPATKTHAGAAFDFAVDAALSDQVAALARQAQGTLYMVLTAALGVLMARYRGGDDVVIGSPFAGRDLEVLEPLIGFFANTLALRVRLADASSVHDLLARVRHDVLEAHAHQDVPFDKVVEVLGCERNPGYTPLFQVMLTVQNVPPTTMDLPGLQVEAPAAENATAKFDLTLSFTQTPRGLAGNLEYNRDLFHRSTMTRLVGHFRTLLEGFVRTPHETPAALPLLTAEEQHTLLHVWNTPARTPAADAPCLHQRLARVAGTAVVDAHGDLSYAALDGAADHLAHYLATVGVSVEDRVAVCLPRSREMVVGILAVLKAGAAYVPLDPAYPAARLEAMLADACIAHVVTTAALAALFPAETTCVLLDSGPLRLEVLTAQPPAPVLPARPSPENACYVIYTSGSTGRPKGVVISHRAINNHMLWLLRTFPMEPADRLLQKTPLTFDASVWEVFAPLMAGAVLVMAHPEAHREPRLLAADLHRYGITWLQTVPSLLEALLDEASFAGYRGLTRMFCGGETLSNSLRDRFFAAMGHATLVNFYGPTEVCINATHAVCRADRAVDLGRPLDNTDAYILDRHLRLLPAGVPGELVLGGENLSRGYLGRPALTATVFVPHPFAQNPGDRLYRTHDLACFDGDGRIHYKGRIDHQVKLRGQRLEPGEIEAVLMAHPAVRRGLVLVREDRPGHQVLTAYLVVDGAREAEVFSTYLEGQLPRHMVPTAWVFLDALPLLSNGKVDRKALPLPEGGDTAAFQAPRTHLEAHLAAIWSEVLGVAPIGVDDSFFALGGHSLLATRLTSRLRTRLGVDLPVRAVFEAPTLAQLAQRLAQLDGDELPPPILPAGRLDRPPLSFAQQRLWFLDRLAGGHDTTYTIPLAMRLRGVLDANRLERALQAVVARHTALRTVFGEDMGEPYQVILSTKPVLPLYDLRGLAADAAEAQAVRLVAADAEKTFDLAEGPLLRAGLVRLQARDHVLLLAMHHIITDGWSLDVFSRELAQAYETPEAYAARPAPTLQYSDYAVWQRRWLDAARQKKQVAYWKAQLKGCPARLDLPLDRPRGAVATYAGADVPLRLDAALSTALRGLADQAGASLFMTVLTGFAALLARTCTCDDLVIGTPVAGRDREELEPLIGLFVNTLALRINLAGEPSFAELLGRVRHTTLAAYQHQDLPFERLVDALQVRRDRGVSPLFQVMCVMAHETPGGLTLPGISAAPVQGGDAPAKFDLTLHLTETATGLEGFFNFNRGLFDRETIAAMAARFERFLTHMVAHPEASPCDLPVLSAEEAERVLHQWNRTETDAAAHCAPMHRRFFQMVEQYPDAVALRMNGQSHTYAAVAQQAVQLAACLRRQGVGPERVVGICLPRCPEMVAAVLAVLAAGAAYLPLDPEYPSRRLTWMLSDSGTSLVICSAAQHAVLAGFDGVLLDPHAQTDHTYEAPVVLPDHLAYMIYTSGSTGRPKAAMISHRGLANLTRAYRDLFAPGPGFVVAQLASFSFDASVCELGLALTSGATLLLLTRADLLAPKVLVRRFREERVALAIFSPSLLASLPVTPLPDLKHLLVAGEACPPDLMRAWRRHRAFYNAYGPTEASVCTTLEACDRDWERPPIGRPIANLRTYICDPRGRPVAVGTSGELLVGGIGLARGYRQRPGLTAARFVPDGFGGAPGGRLYRTGDLVRHLADGRIDFLSRIDHQVKLRGFRIETGEIEAALAAREDVVQAMVLVRRDGADQACLAAYVRLEAGGGDPAELRAYLAERLPEFMVPSVVVALDSFPLTPNGKVDREALPAPEDVRTEAAAAPPRTALERRLAATWEKVLGRKIASVHEDFFALGGHSLSAVKLIAQLEHDLDRRFDLAWLFQAPTIAGMARLAEADAGGQASPLVRLSEEGRGTPIFLVHPVGGDVFAYRALAAGLARPVYGLRSPGLYGGAVPERLADTAALYLQTLRDAGHEGPLILAGWSLGGLIAHEMACLAQAEGLEVAALVLLDSYLFDDAAPALDEGAVVRAFAADLAGTHGMDLDLDDAPAEDLLAERVVRAGLLPDLGAFQRLLAVFRANLQAAAGYRPGTFRGTALYFRAADGAGADPLPAWRALPGLDLRVVTLNATHHTLLRAPAVGELQHQLETLLAPQTVP